MPLNLIMPLLLPFVSFLFFILLLKKNFPAILWREAILISFLALGGFIILSKESLSIFQLFKFYPLCVLWALIFLILLVLYAGKKSRPILWKLLPNPVFTSAEKLIFKCIILLALVLGFLAVFMPPNTWDAMTYHLSRVAHWIQNGTVKPYPTNIQRQLMINPFSEYWIAQFQILSGGDDYWANSVQWLSMIGSLIGISLIAQELGLGRLAQILSMFFVITLPNAIVQSTSTQTDFVTTLWCVIAVYFILKNIRQLQWKNTLGLSVAGGLSFYTKGASLFIILPFAAWMIFNSLKTRQRILPHAILIITFLSGACGLILLKNYSTFGNFVFPGVDKQILPLNSVKGMISNQMLHIGMHLKIGIPQFDNDLTNVLESFHHLLGTTITTSPANNAGIKFDFADGPFFEDIIPNFLFMFFYICFGIHYLIFKRNPLSSLKGKFFAISLLCFFIFNCLNRWSPFDGRYHLPFFVLFAPFLADVFAARKYLFAVVVLFFLGAVPFILFNCAKPLISKSGILTTPRDMRYFYNNPDALGPIRDASQIVLNSGCSNLGIEFTEDSWEYPWWAYLRKSSKPIRIEHINIKNPSANLPYPWGNFLPCGIVSVQNSPDLNFQGRNYSAVQNYGVFSLYFPKTN